MKQFKTLKVTVSLLCVISLLLGCLLTFSLSGAAAGSSEVPTNLTNITWADYGLAGQYTSNVHTADKNGTYAGSIDGTLLSGYVTQSAGNHLRIGGTSDASVAAGAGAWGGLIYRPNGNNDGASLVVDGSVAIPGWYMEVDAADVGMTGFYGEEYFLQQSIEFVDNDNDGAEDDLKLGVWINGVMVAPLDAANSGCADDGYVYVNDGAATFGSLMMAYPTFVAGSSITLRNYKAIPTTLTEYTWGDFEPSSSLYPLTLGSALTYAGQGYKYGSSDADINNTIFNGDISIPAVGNYIRWFSAASAWGWQGMQMETVLDANDNNVHKLLFHKQAGGVDLSITENVYLHPANFGLTSFVGERFNLKMAITDRSADGTSATLSVWINDYWALDAAVTSKASNPIGVTFVPVASGGAGQPAMTPYESSKPIEHPEQEIPTDVPVLGWEDFGVEAGADMTSAAENYRYADSTSLENTLLDVDVSISGENSEIRYTGTTENPWIGMQIRLIGNNLYLCSDTMALDNGDVAIVPADFGLTTFADTKFNLKVLVTDVSDDAQTATYTVWINDLYAAKTTATLKGDFVGNHLANAILANGKVTAYAKEGSEPDDGPAVDENIPTDYTNLTWTDFSGLGVGTYPAVASDLSGKGTYNGSLDQTLFSGDIVFGSGTEIRYASNDGWQGLRIRVDSSDQLNIFNSTFATDYSPYYTPDTFGLTTLIDTPINLKIALDIDDAGENYTFTVWVNNIKAGDSFTLEKGNSGVGSMLSLYANESGNAMQIVGEVAAPETFPSDFTVYTPANGNIADGVYNVDRVDDVYDVDTGAISGITNFDKSALVFEKVSFDGTLDMNFFGTTADLGFKFRTNSNGTVTLTSGWGEFIPGGLTMTDDIAGVDLVGGTYKLAFTLEYVTDTQVKLGVWFNDVLYNNQYIEVDTANKNDKLGNYLFAVIGYNGTGVITIGEQTVAPEKDSNIPTDLINITWGDLTSGLTDGTFTRDTSGYFVGSGLVKADDIMLRGYVTQNVGEHLNVFGPSTNPNWGGIKLVVENATQLKVLGSVAVWNNTSDDWGGFLIDAASVGMTAFENTEYFLQVSSQYVDNDNDGAEDDLKLGMWINGYNLANISGNDNAADGYFYFNDHASRSTGYLTAGFMAGQAGAGITLRSYYPEATSTIGWEEFGLAGGETLEKDTSYSASVDTMNNTLFVGDVTMPEGTELRYNGAAENAWVGLQLKISGGKLVVCSDTMRQMDGQTGFSVAMDPATAGLTTFADTKFNLKIQVYDLAGNRAAYRVWANDQLVTTVIAAATGDFASYTLAANILANGEGIVVGTNGGSSGDDDQLETLPTDYTLLYPSDFGIADGTYEMANSSYVGHTGSIAGVTRIDKSILVFDEFTLSGQEVHMNFFGKTEDLGWKLISSGDVLQLTSGWQQVTVNNGYPNIIQLDDEIAGVDLVGGTYCLKISIVYDGDVAKLGLWFNDVLYDNTYFVFDTSDEGRGNDDFGSHLAFRSDSTGTVTIKTTSKQPSGPVEPPVITPSTPSEDLKEITFRDYGLEDGSYETDCNAAYTKPIDGTVFSGYITQSTGNDFRLGGTSDTSVAEGAKEWGGLIYRPNLSNGGATLDIHGSVAIPGWYMTVNASAVGMTSFIGEEYFLQQSIEFVDNDNDGAEDDLKLGIWINGIMVTALDANTSGCASDGYVYVNDGAATFGNLMLLVVTKASGMPEDGSIIIRSDPNVEEELPEAPPADTNIPTDLTVLEWDDFAPLTNATYAPVPGALAGLGIYDGSLDGTILDGDIAFGAGTQLRYAGNDGWQGLILGVNASGQFFIDSSTFGTKYSAVYAATSFGLKTFVDTTINLKIALDIDDAGENYTFRLWINDIKVSDAFTLAKGDCGVGSAIGLYDNASGNSVTLSGADVPEPVEVPKPTDPSKLAVISLKSFGLADGPVAADTVNAGVMMYPASYDGTVFKVTVDLTTDTPVGGSYMRFGGANGGWLGLGLETSGDGTLRLIDWKTSSPLTVAVFDPATAGVDFYNGPFDVQISFEYVAADDDGVKNDVLVGVYFNGKCYDEAGYVVKDFEMTNALLTYVTTNKDGSVQPMSLNGVSDVATLVFDFTEFGFTKDFFSTFKSTEREAVRGVPQGVTLAPFTGEPAEAVCWILVMAAAVALSVLLIVKRTAKKARK